MLGEQEMAVKELQRRVEGGGAGGGGGGKGGGGVGSGSKGTGDSGGDGGVAGEQEMAVKELQRREGGGGVGGGVERQLRARDAGVSGQSSGVVSDRGCVVRPPSLMLLLLLVVYALLHTRSQQMTNLDTQQRKI